MHIFTRLTGIFSALVVIPVYAQYPQHPQGMTQEQMQQMMQGMMNMAGCYQNIDQQKLEAMGREAQAKEKELKALCAKGERDKAQQEAMTYAQKYMNSEEFQQIKACGEMARGMMPAMPDYSVYISKDSGDDSNRHICDDL